MNLSPSHLDDFLAYLRFPSVSTDPAHQQDVANCADWLMHKLARAGLQPEKHETPGHPIIVARNEHRADRRTILVYGHYDVQPAQKSDGWATEPFDPVIKESTGQIFARGASDNKGQNLAHILGIEETMQENGDLPINLILLLEGEEEIGSPNLAPFLEAHKADLACDVVAVSDTGMIDHGIGTLTYGLRGVAALEVTVTGPSIDLHSGIFGGAVANPASALARLVASLHGADGRIAIDGFYDRVVPLSDWERQNWSTIPGGDDETALRLTGSPTLFGETGYTQLERRWARPTAEVNGLRAGWQGPGSKTIVPHEAVAKLTFRLVPDQCPETILDLAIAHLERHCPPGVQLHILRGHAGPPYLLDPHSEFAQAACRALRSAFNCEPALIREGGSIPIVQSFKDILHADTLLLGLALPDCQIHAPDENFYLSSFEAGIKMNRILLAELARP